MTAHLDETTTPCVDQPSQTFHNRVVFKLLHGFTSRVFSSGVDTQQMNPPLQREDPALDYDLKDRNVVQTGPYLTPEDL